MKGLRITRVGFLIAVALAAFNLARGASSQRASLFDLSLSASVSADEERTSIDPGADFLSFAANIVAWATPKAEGPTSLLVRVTTDEVAGTAKGTVVVTSENAGSFDIDAEKHRGFIFIPFPAGGLSPGRYRLDVLDAAEPDRVVGTTDFATHYPSIAAAGALSIVMSTTIADDGQPVDPGTVFSSLLPHFWLTVGISSDDTLIFRARIIAEETKDLPKSYPVTQTDPGVQQTVSPDVRTGQLEIPLPRMGLPPGRYRVEVVEVDRPNRVATQTTFVVRPIEKETEPLNLADSELGGTLESITGEEGVGLTWSSLLLVRDNAEFWVPPLHSPATADATETYEMPCEMVVSFFQREMASFGAVELVSSDDNAPRQVEIWGSMQSATEGFVKIGEITSEERPRVLVVPVSADPVRFLKVRILSTHGSEGFMRLTGIRAIESTAPGYGPLLKRQPALADWRLQPRHAAQRGLHFLQPEAVKWQNEKQCMGCHVQAQALMGISIARKNDYVVSNAAERVLADYTRASQNDPGDFARTPAHDTTDELSTSAFAALGLAYAQPVAGSAAQLERAARWIVAHQGEDGSVHGDDGRAPVDQGEIMFTSNCVDVWSTVLEAQNDPALRSAIKRALAFIEGAEVATTQDEAFKILALARHGDAAQKKFARASCLKLQREQHSDGGWALELDESAISSSSFATGQALYAMRVAGVSLGTPAFQRGVLFLLATQDPNGSWKDPALASRLAATMWPVIALTGAFGHRAEPAHITVVALPPPPPPPKQKPAPVAPPPVVVTQSSAPALPKNILFVLDCSFSMNERLGKSTRLATAKQVMRDIIAKLPDDANVGLRLYGHRYDSMTSRSSADTELIVPVQKLNRAALLGAIDPTEARGQTPLVYSTLQAGADLKKIGGGTIIVVTDGEESCGGKPRLAGAQLAALGVPLRLDVIGFTLTGKRVVDDMTAFTQPTAGRFYSAADGTQLGIALVAAISPAPRVAPPPPPPAAEPEPELVEMKPEDLPYEIFDAAGAKVAASTTLSVEVPDLEPGQYRVVLRAGGKEVSLAGITLGASETAELTFTPADGSLRRTH